MVAVEPLEHTKAGWLVVQHAHRHQLQAVQVQQIQLPAVLHILQVDTVVPADIPVVPGRDIEDIPAELLLGNPASMLHTLTLHHCQLSITTRSSATTQIVHICGCRST